MRVLHTGTNAGVAVARMLSLRVAELFDHVVARSPGPLKDRLRAVLMTAALAALGLIPAAFSRAIGSETQRPIAVVIVGGTLSAALLTLVVLPVMYRLLLRRLREDGALEPTPPLPHHEPIPPPPP